MFIFLRHSDESPYPKEARVFWQMEPCDKTTSLRQNHFALRDRGQMTDYIAPDLCLQPELQTLFIMSIILGSYSTIQDMQHDRNCTNYKEIEVEDNEVGLASLTCYHSLYTLVYRICY